MSGLRKAASGVPTTILVLGPSMKIRKSHLSLASPIKPLHRVCTLYTNKQPIV